MSTSNLVECNCLACRAARVLSNFKITQGWKNYTGLKELNTKKESKSNDLEEMK